ncbi:MAG: helix-turn-helix domain-containing protein [Candidatus Caldarchaeum sp.]
MVEVDEGMKRALMNTIAGEVIFSNRPGDVLKKWRLLFEESQKNLAEAMGVASSVLSDYEKSRRRSPGTEFIKKYVSALISLDEAKGGGHVKKFAGAVRDLSGVVLGMAEYTSPKTLAQVAKALKGVWLAGQSLMDSYVYGYTVIDSLQAIRRLESHDFLRLFGGNSVRVVVFTNVSRGRSPIIAAKIFPIRPRMIAIHGPKSAEEVDRFAVELAAAEGIPYVLSLHDNVEAIVNALSSL